MSTGTITGTIVFPTSPSGFSQSIPIGAPVIIAASLVGAQLNYTESATKTLLVTQADGVVTVSFDAIASADILYVGTDQPISVKMNGSATAITLAAGGYILIYKGSMTSMTVQATTSNSATISMVLLGA